MLAKNVDDRVIQYLKGIREAGSVVNVRVAIGAAMGIAKALEENGGFLCSNSKAFAKSLLGQIDFVKQKGTKTSKKLLDNFHDLHASYASAIKETMEKESIPPEMVVNFDETGLPIVPQSDWTMEEKGSKQVPLVGLDDKRQITGVLACSLTGELLPPQLLYEGTTTRCHPKFIFPTGWDVWHLSTHWSTPLTIVRYIQNVLLPYFDVKRKRFSLHRDHPALVILDIYKAHTPHTSLKCSKPAIAWWSLFLQIALVSCR